MPPGLTIGSILLAAERGADEGERQRGGERNELGHDFFSSRAASRTR